MTLARHSFLACLLGAAVACVSVFGACGSPTRGEEDPRLCPKTYEFGNHGCADVVGQVLGSAGQPLGGITVSPRYRADIHGFDSPYRTTDPEGRFRLRLTRFSGLPPTEGPDTVSVYIGAFDPRSAALNVPATVHDSVLVQVTVAPVGAAASVTEVVVRLPTP